MTAGLFFTEELLCGNFKACGWNVKITIFGYCGDLRNFLLLQPKF